MNQESKDAASQFGLLIELDPPHQDEHRPARELPADPEQIAGGILLWLNKRYSKESLQIAVGTLRMLAQYHVELRERVYGRIAFTSQKASDTNLDCDQSILAADKMMREYVEPVEVTELNLTRDRRRLAFMAVLQQYVDLRAAV